MRRNNSRQDLVAMAAAVLALMPVSSAWAQGGGGLRIKNRSTFNAVENRNPFWPVGFVPGMASAKPERASAPRTLVKAEDFNLTSISSFGGTRLAMINGKPVGEGDSVKVSLGGQPTRIQVVSVTDGTVVVRYEGQELKLVLKRADMELMTRPIKAEPLLNSQKDL